MIIYLVTNKTNSKQYVGLTTLPLAHRWARHVASARSHSTRMRLHLAIRKYGADNFTVEQIDSADTLDDLKSREQAHIARLNTRSTGYNMTDGGEGALGRRMTPEQLAAHRERCAARRGKPSNVSLEGRRSIGQASASRNAGAGNPNFGKRHSHATRQLIRERALARTRAPGYVHHRTGVRPPDKFIEDLRQRMRKNVGALNSRSKKWRLISPTGDIFETVSLRQFCIQHGLAAPSLQRAARLGRAVSSGPSQGWAAQLLTD